MANSTAVDVKKLLELAVRMGIPPAEAIRQVRELSAEVAPVGKRVAGASTA